VAVATSSDPRLIEQQAGMVAAAWAPQGAPASWRLTAAQMQALADGEELLALAATIPPDRLPPPLFVAAATVLVLELEPWPLRSWFPRVGEPQPPIDPGLAAAYRGFCLDHRERLLELCARHRYQMNEVGRCADVVPALARDGREVVLIDVGTGAGLGLHLDRYRYVYRRPRGEAVSVGEPDAGLAIEVEVRGPHSPPVPDTLPRLSERIGIDVEPLELSRPSVRAWLAACVPQEIGAVTRFHGAAEIATSDPARMVRGDACEVLPEVLGGIDRDVLVCLVDSYVHVFFPAEERERFRELVDAAGVERDLDWVSVDPLVPMGRDAQEDVLGIPVPAGLVERNRREGCSGSLGGSAIETATASRRCWRSLTRVRRDSNGFQKIRGGERDARDRRGSGCEDARRCRCGAHLRDRRRQPQPGHRRHPP
jgi:hypothetical protein